MQCVPDDTEFEILNKEKFNVNSCDNTIVIKSKHACPLVNYYIIAAYLDKYKIYSGIVIIVIGLFLVFLGNKFIKVTILLVGVIATITFVFMIYFTIFKNIGETHVWILLGVGGAVGLVLGFCLCKCVKVFIMILGGYLGYLVSIFIYDLLLNNIHASPQVIYWITTLSCIIVFALLALWLSKVAVVITTSITGGYMVIRGASLYIGGFPSESMVVDLINNEEWDGLQNVI
jgi:hypothetical protein